MALSQLFGLSTKPQDLVRTACDAARELEAGRPSGSVSRSIAEMKQILYGTPDQPNKQAPQALELAVEVLRSGLLESLLERLPLLEFECRKDLAQVCTCSCLDRFPAPPSLPSLTRGRGANLLRPPPSLEQVFSNLLRRQIDGEYAAVGWLEARAELLLTLLRGYEQPEVAINYGSMLRECMRHERLARRLLDEPTAFPTLFRHIESPHFDVASDAYASARDLLTKHKAVVADYLQANYDTFFTEYMKLARHARARRRSPRARPPPAPAPEPARHRGPPTRHTPRAAP